MGCLVRMAKWLFYISHSDDFGKGSSLSITPLSGFTNKLSANNHKEIECGNV
jgi:hypothetical protein